MKKIFLILLITTRVYAGLDSKDGKVVNVATPTLDTDATTKLYVDDLLRYWFGDGGIADYTDFNDFGSMIMYGDARVTSHIVIDAAAMRVTGGSHGEAGCFNYVSFTNNQDDVVYFITRVPYRRAAGTDLSAILRWYYTGGNDNNTCEWNLTYNSIKEGEDPTAAGTALAEQAIAIATDDTLGLVTFTIPSAALEADDDLGVKIWRDGSDALTANALLIGVHIHFTMDKLGEPPALELMLFEDDDVMLFEDGNVMSFE